MTQHEERAVWYEPHPVTPERKAEIRAHGFVIVDDAFRPDGHSNPDVPGLRSEVAATDAAAQSIDDIKAVLTQKGISFRANASKANLQALLDAADKQGD